MLASAIKVLELRDVFATGAIPVMRSVVVQTGLMARVEASRRRQQEDEALDINALIHVYAGFGGVPYTIRGVAAGYYTQSTSEFIATTVGPFQMASKADLDLIVRETNDGTLFNYARQEQLRRSGVGVYEPTVAPDEHRLGTPADKQRIVDFRDSQLLMALKKNGWPSNLRD